MTFPEMRLPSPAIKLTQGESERDQVRESIFGTLGDYLLTKAAITASVGRMACAKVGPLIWCAECIASGLNAAVASRTSVTW